MRAAGDNLRDTKSAPVPEHTRLEELNALGLPLLLSHSICTHIGKAMDFMAPQNHSYQKLLPEEAGDLDAFEDERRKDTKTTSRYRQISRYVAFHLFLVAIQALLTFIILLKMRQGHEQTSNRTNLTYSTMFRH